MVFNASKPVIALKTLAAINLALEKDQGNLFRRYLREAIPLAEDAYRENNDPFRTHLGASLIGRECPRELWYTFRWTTRVTHKGRLVRLFNRGHLEEARFVALLKMINCEVWQHDSNGKQFRVSFEGGHFGGSLDAVVRGVPDDPFRPLLSEFKTHGKKSFDKLAGSDWQEFLLGKEPFNGEGVRSAKFEHYVQMQTYMGGYQLPRALYLAVNKDNDGLYAELVNFDPEIFDLYRKRANFIVNAVEPPKKVGDTPGWYTCRFCDQRIPCHLNGVPDRNCRTCVNSAPVEGGWACSRYGALSKEQQLAGCTEYERFF